MKARFPRIVAAMPVVAAVVAAAALVIWWTVSSGDGIKLRLPGTDQPPGGDKGDAASTVLAGRIIQGNGSAADLPGAWPQFRGPNRDGISRETTALARSWPATGPRELWSVEAGEGYAGAAVSGGRVFLMDYDRENKQGALRCLSLLDGREIWRYAYPLSLKRNHGMTRTVPAVSGKSVVAMDSKCNVLCLEADTGRLRWGINLVPEFGATVPPWYTGQCPLIDGDKVILAPGGPKALLLAVALESGTPAWQTPNPHSWKMTHSSVMPAEFGGRHGYVWCGSGGVAGVSAADGALVWETNAWKISIATVPSPLVLDGGRIFLAGGYNAGSLMLQLKQGPGSMRSETVFKLGPENFGATQHTPVFYDGHIYGVRPNGQFVCLDLAGKVLWASPVGDQFGLGSFLLANGVFFVINDSGKLSLVEATPARFNLLAQAQVLHDRESWGPMALAGGRLLARDFTHLACFDVSDGKISLAANQQGK